MDMRKKEKAAKEKAASNPGAVGKGN